MKSGALAEASAGKPLTRGARQAADSVAPLLRFLSGIKNTFPLAAKDRESHLGQLVKDLRTAARVLDQFDSSIQEAWTLFEDLVECIRREGLELKASRGPRPTGASAMHAIDRAAEELLPRNLMSQATALWRQGLGVGTSNRLARAGFRTLTEILALRPVSRLKAIQGLGCAVIAEVETVLRAKGFDPGAGVAPPLTLSFTPKGQLPARTKRRVVEWEAVRQTVRKALERLGGSASLTELLRENGGIPYARLKRGLLELEREGSVSRTGVRRSTRYHLKAWRAGIVDPENGERRG